MCGLVGMVTKNRNGFSSSNFDLFETLLFLDQLRGMDSTGVFLVNNIGNVSIAKAAIHSTDFIPTPEFKRIRQDGISNGWALIGHNRKATRGNITDENAHPFWVDDKVVLVHNGTMYGDHKQHADVEVDSNAIAHILAEEEDVGVAMRKINAAYALMWYNVQKKHLNILRNSQRPLTWAETADAYYFASEPGMLEYASERTNIPLQKGPFTFEPNELDVWALGEDKLTTVTTTKINCEYKYVAPVGAAPVSAPNFTDDEHPLADRFSCAYWGGDDCDDTPPELVRLRAAAADAAMQEAIETARASVNPKPELVLVETKVKDMPRSMFKHTFEEWELLKKAYPDGSKVKVVCEDYVPDDNGMKSVFMIGTTEDANKVHVIFPIPVQLFKEIMDPASAVGKEKKAVFYVEVNGCRWRKAGDSESSHAKTPGWVTINGRVGAKLYQHAGNRVQ